jgi:hypothetical protein
MNVKIGTQPFRYDMLGRFGFTLLPFFEGKENQGQTELLNDLAKLMYDKYMETLEYYYRNPNKLKSDFRMHSEHDFETQPEDKKKIDFEWAKKVAKLVEKHFENAFKEPEQIDENNNLSFGFDDDIKQNLRKLGLDDQRVEQLIDLHTKWLEMVRDKYSAEDIAQKLFTYNQNLNKVNEAAVIEDKVVDKRSEDEISKKSDGNDIKGKQLEKIAGLINKKLVKKDIDKLINLLESAKEETEFSAEDKQKIKDFVMNYKGAFKDEDIHTFADKIGLDKHEVEEFIYDIARKELKR